MAGLRPDPLPPIRVILTGGRGAYGKAPVLCNTPYPWSAFLPTVTKLTTKHQTALPLEVRRALDLEVGDWVEFRVEGRTVTLRKAGPPLSDDLVFRLVQTDPMRDWDTPEDDEAFRGL
jgi:antitoxin PrlF